MKVNENIYLVDVREEREWGICKLPDSNQIPPRMVQDVASMLPKDKDIVVYCHHGLRSSQAVEMIKKSGHGSVRNLSGGINQWAREVDNDMAQY